MSTIRRLRIAISADARIALRFRAELFDGPSRRGRAREILRLCVSSVAFLALLLYRTFIAIRELRNTDRVALGASRLDGDRYNLVQ